MATPCFYLNVAIRGYDADVFVNGAPIVRASRGYPCIVLPPVSEWIVQGENVLTVAVEGGDALDPPGESEAGAAPPPADEPPRLRVALCRGELGEFVEPGRENELVVIDWTPPPPPGEGEEPLALPHEVRAAVDLSHPWGAWSWESAPAFDLWAEPETVVEVATFLADLHAALERGQLDPLLDASRPKLEEVAPCYDMDPAAARQRLVAAWPEITKAPGFRLAPFDEADLELRTCCGGRVLEPRSLAGEPVLRQAEALEGQRWSLPLYLARIDGKLAIVR
ncbi:MAG TPA: hypothetical protein VIL20_04570 [Sandaracinaceae bacterium]